MVEADEIVDSFSLLFDPISMVSYTVGFNGLVLTGWNVIVDCGIVLVLGMVVVSVIFWTTETNCLVEFAVVDL